MGIGPLRVDRMTRQCTYLIRLFLLYILLVAVSWPRPVTAQGGVTWSEPFNISDSPTGSVHPAIVTDAYGFVHVFWSENLDGESVSISETPGAGNTIMYRHWDGKRWTEAISVLAPQGDPLADFVAVAVDDENRLHLVWTGLTRLYYSSAMAIDANSVRAWSEPYVISFESARSQWETDIAVDADCNIHIVYATRGTEAGVFHVEKACDSQRWTLPNRISDSLRWDEVAFKDVRLVVDKSGRLHVTWSTSNFNGYSQAVFYARRESSRLAWEAPVLLADAKIETGFTGFPNLLTYGSDALLLVHVDQENKGRIERTSSDAGLTWSDPRFILLGMEGVNGFSIPLRDSGGGLHLIINMRPSADQRTGIYYAPRRGLDWSPIVSVAVEAPSASSAHYTDATVRLGNEIHVVWTQLRGGEIWHVRGIINDLDTLPAQELPEIVEPTPTPTERVRVSDSVDAPIGVTYAQASTPPQAPNAWLTAVAAAVPVSLLVTVAVVWRMRKR